MNTLEELIQKECPEGVEFKTLGECGEFIRGCGLQKKDFTDTGFPCIHYGQIHTQFNTHTNHTVAYTSEEYAKKLKKAQPGDLLIATTSEDVDACCKAVTWLGKTEVAVSGDMYIYHHNQNPKYMSYLFKTKQFADYKKKVATGAKVVRVSGENIAKFKFAFPSLSEQEKIANILDKFTSLEAELEAELEARKKQYEYYRNQLLDFTGREDVEWKTLGEISVIKTGQKPTEILEFGKYEYINAGTTNSGFSDSYNCIGDVTTTPSRGQGGIGFVGYQKDNFWLGPLCYGIRSKCDFVINKFIYYFLSCRNDLILGFKNVGGVPSLNVKDLITIEIPIPPLSEQHRIVTILDKFEALINGQTASLAAEIKARHQQYEYYRDKLLTFQRKES